MKIRKISAILVAVMMISLLSGCGKKEEGSIESMQSDYSKYVTLGTYKGVEYTPQKTEVTDDDIKYYANSLVYQNTIQNPVYEGVATEGDTVNIDFVGYVDGESFEGGDSQGQGYDLVLGSHSFIDDFEEQIVGHSPGDAFDVNVTFPEDYGSEDLAGKEALFETTLNYIVDIETPEYDDALVATATDYSTVEEFETAKRAELEEQNATNDLNADKNSIITSVIDSSNVTEYPAGEVEERVQAMMDSVTEEAEANGVDVDSYLSNYGYTLDTFKDQVKESVETYIREKMIFLTIAGIEGITATQEETDAKVDELLAQSGLTDKETLSSVYGYTDDDYAYEVIYQKVVDFIYENAVAVDAPAEEASENDGEMIDDYGTTEEE
ncbi:MAG: trigger factor [Eubacterium sp.]|nr:trigger factor [Eubacterium sp.]